MSKPPTPSAQRTARQVAASSYLLPLLLYASLVVVPDWWSPAARSWMLFQFFVIEFSAGLLATASGRLLLSRRQGWQSAVGAYGIVLAVLAAVLLTAWHTRDAQLTLLVATGVLPRAFEAVRALRGGPPQAALLLREGAIGMASCLLIGLGWFAMMSAGPDDPPGTYSVSPPLWLSAGAMTLHYLLLLWLARHGAASHWWLRHEAGDSAAPH